MQAVFVWILVLVICTTGASAQQRKLGDWGFFCIDKPFPEKEKSRIVPVVLFDGQNMFVGNRAVRLGGIKAGARDRKTGIQAGLGFYAFTNRLQRDPEFIADLGQVSKIESDFGLISVFIEPRVFQNKRFLVTAPVSYGFGRVEQFYTSVLGSLIPYRDFRLNALSVQASGQFNIFYWLGIGGGLGYQFFGVADKQLQKEYSGLSYNIRLKIDIIDLYKTITFQLDKQSDNEP